MPRKSRDRRLMARIALGVMVAFGCLIGANAYAAGLQCNSPGSHQDVVKTPKITNTTGQMLAAGTMIGWNASDGDQGQMVLGNNLYPGGVTLATGHTAGQVYTCTAYLMTPYSLNTRVMKYRGNWFRNRR